MSAKRAHFSSSVKTIPDAQPNRRTASLQHQKSFNGEDDPEAASIRSTFPAAQKPSEEQETTSDNDEANTTFVTQQTINLDPEDDEKPILERPQVHAASLSIQENLGPCQPTQVGSFLAQLEIAWQETRQEMYKTAPLCSDTSLSPNLLEWYRRHYVDLREQEKSLRGDIGRLTPVPPMPMDPHLKFYQEALHAYRETLQEYWSKRPHP